LFLTDTSEPAPAPRAATPDDLQQSIVGGNELFASSRFNLS
jgi:hypothetical protein